MHKNKASFARQFKRGTFPDQHWDESTRVNDHKEEPPEKARGRNSLGVGTQTEARPGMVGKQDFKRKK